MVFFLKKLPKSPPKIYPADFFFPLALDSTSWKNFSSLPRARKEKKKLDLSSAAILLTFFLKTETAPSYQIHPHPQTPYLPPEAVVIFFFCWIMARFQDLYRVLVVMIGEMLPHDDLARLGQTSRAMLADVRHVPLNINKWCQMKKLIESVRPGRVGCIQSVCVSNLDELAELHKYPTIRRIMLGCGFDQPLINIVFPPKLTHLEFGWHFDQPVEQLDLPQYLTHLRFGHNFNHSLTRLVLPDRLSYIDLGWMFDQPLAGWRLPPSLVFLRLSNNCVQSLEHLVLPRRTILQTHSRGW